MAYIVIALGVVLALVGGYLLNYGYAIVQVERGWSSVIAGSVFVAGGLTIASTGLLIRALGRLGGLAAARPVETVADTSAPHAAADPAPIVTSAAIASGLPLAAETRGPTHEPAPEEPDWHAGPPEAHLVAEAPDEPPEGRPAPGAEPEAIHSPEPHPEPIEAEQTGPEPAMDDWLDRAFSDLDHVPPPRAATAPLTLEPERVPEPAHAEQAADAPAVAPTPAPAEPAPPGDGPQSAVIGRYESDGTSYVMYADGSIEAQSAAGVYRFSSMAELRSFIES